MTKETKPLRIPEIGEFVRGTGTLVEIMELPPPPPPPKKVHYVFEEQNGRIELRVKGKKIKEIATYNDFYGLGSGVETAVEEAKVHMASLGIDSQSDLEIVVVRITSRARHEIHQRDYSFYSPEFFKFDTARDGSLRGMPEPVEQDVWSSRHPEEPAK